MSERWAIALGSTRRGTAELDRAVQEIGDHRDDEGDDERGEDPVDEEGQEREPEDEEADVAVEERVESAERQRVLEQDPVLPLPRRSDPEDEGDHERDHACAR